MKRTPLQRGKSQLKRTGFKKKARKPLRKKSPQTVAKLQRDIWKLLREKLRKQYGNICYTCDQTGLKGANWHIGHLWAKASLGAFLKYDERVLRSQCYRCNIHFGGNGAEFYKRMSEEIGGDQMHLLELDKIVLVNARDHYTKLLAELKK